MSNLTPGSDVYNLLMMHEYRRSQCCRQRMLELVRNGIHLFQSEAHRHQVSLFQSVYQKELVRNGIHLFQSEAHRHQVSEYQKAMVDAGDHGFQKEEICHAADDGKAQTDDTKWHRHYCELLEWKAEKEV